MSEISQFMKIALALFFASFPFLSIPANASQDCQEKLAKAICIVNSPVKEPDRYKPNRPCIEGETKRYSVQVLDAYGSFPAPVKKILCSVQTIYIEKDFFGTAWSAAVDESDPQEMLLGLNIRELDAQLRLESFLSWFEQLSFGGAKDFTISPLLPMISIDPPRWKSATFLTNTLLHESGHLLDYKYGFNKFVCSDPNKCKPLPGSWGEIAWLSNSTPRPDNDFDQRPLICINRCQAVHLDPKKSTEFYRDLFQSGFVSQLSAISPMEDFAETFSLYERINAMDQQINLKDTNGNLYDVKLVLKSDPLKQKVKFIENILKELK
jgi:hypothetical protein